MENLARLRRVAALVRLGAPQSSARPAISRVEDDYDPIMGSMAGTVKKLLHFSRLAGHNVGGSIDLPNGATLEIPRPTEMVVFSDRLVELLGATQSIAPDAGLPRRELLREVLKADGWSWHAKSIKTPAWMETHREVSWGVTAVEVGEDLSWLGKQGQG